MRKFLDALLLLVLFSSASFAADDAIKKIASTVDSHYNSMQSFKADFMETYSGNGITRKESGTLSLKRPGKMRWDYREPSQKLFLSDGKTAYFYVPGEHQARKTAIKNLDDFRSPLRYLLGKTRLEKEFDHLAIAASPLPTEKGNIVLSGVPKGMGDRVTHVLLEVTSSGQIRRISIEEIDGATTEFIFANILENLPLDEARFHFSPPSGVETIEATDLGG